MIDLYKIDGAKNNDSHSCYNDPESYPLFQENLSEFKDHISSLVKNTQSKTLYKFGDGDYHFLIKNAFGSAKPGNRALSVSYENIDHEKFTEGVLLNDLYTCELYPQSIDRFHKVVPGKAINYPTEYLYGLVANKWFFKNLSQIGKIGVIGAGPKIQLIEMLCEYDEYKDYLGFDGFSDYITFPQKFACDNIQRTEDIVAEQLKKSKSNVFLLGIGHAKSAVLHTFKKYRQAVFIDVGAGIDAIAGCINVNRPYSGDWTNFRLSHFDYSKVDYLRYTGAGKHKTLK